MATPTDQTCSLCGRQILLESGHFRIGRARVHPECIRLFWKSPREVSRALRAQDPSVPYYDTPGDAYALPLSPEQRQRVLDSIESGHLRLDAPTTMYAGYGAGQMCSGCQDTIGPKDVQYEAEFADGRRYDLHLGCAGLWHAERRRREETEDIMKQSQAATDHALEASKHATVLVVDDLPDARDSMVRPLAAAGFDVRETASGRDTLRLARSQPDAIVLDIVLSDMDGFDVLYRLKTDPATRDIPVILKTAVYDDEGHREVALQRGAAAYVAAPFDPHALVATVRAALGDGSTPTG